MPLQRQLDGPLDVPPAQSGKIDLQLTRASISRASRSLGMERAPRVRRARTGRVKNCILRVSLYVWGMFGVWCAV